MTDDEPSPEPPYTITVTWAVGDVLVVDYPDLQPWEAAAVLAEALEVVTERIEEEKEEAT